MKQLKYLHLAVGLLALAAIVTDGAIAGQLLGYTPFVPPATSLLFTGALLNLCLGCHYTARHTPIRHVQHAGSLAIVAATAISGWTLLVHPTLAQPGSIVLVLFIAGVLLQVLACIKLARPKATAHSSDNSAHEQGTVKWFNITKGFGFITRDVGDDVFVHYRAIRGGGHRILTEGQRVEFVVVDRDKGLQAEDVIPFAD